MFQKNGKTAKQNNLKTAEWKLQMGNLLVPELDIYAGIPYVHDNGEWIKITARKKYRQNTAKQVVQTGRQAETKCHVSVCY